MPNGRRTKHEARSSDSSPASVTPKIDTPIKPDAGPGSGSAAATGKGKKKTSTTTRDTSKGFDLDGVGCTEESSGSGGSGKEGEGDLGVGKSPGGVGGERGGGRGGAIADGEQDGEDGYVSDALPPHSDDKIDDDAGVTAKGAISNGHAVMHRPAGSAWAVSPGGADGNVPGLDEVRRVGAVAIPVAIPPSKPYSLSPHLAKLSRLGSYTYSALSTAATLTSTAATTARAYAASSSSSFTHTSSAAKGYSKSLPNENVLGARRGGLEDLMEEGPDLERDYGVADVEVDVEGYDETGEGVGLLGVGINGHGPGGIKAGRIASQAEERRDQGRGRVPRRSKFIKVDSGDGVPRQCLLLINPTQHVALQIWDVSMAPGGPTERTAAQYEADVQQLQGGTSGLRSGSGLGNGMSMLSSVLLEGSPREIFCLSRGKAGGGAASSGLEGEVVDATIVDLGSNEDSDTRNATLAVVNIVEGEGDGDVNGKIVLVKLDLFTGRVLIRREIGHGYDASLRASERFLAVGLANDAGPELHILSLTDLQTLRKPILSHLGASVASGLPVMALSGRMLAYATRKTRYSGSEPGDRHERGHGAIVTKRSVRKVAEAGANGICTPARDYRGGLSGSSTSRSPLTQHSNLLGSASSVTTQMASGLWGGLKALSTAAVDTAARSGVVSRSAPSESFLSGLSKEPKEVGKAPRRLSVDATDRFAPRRPTPGASWIEVMDLGARTAKLESVASFSLPVKSSGSEDGAAAKNVGCMEFDMTGTQLAIFPEDGRIGFVVEVRPNTKGSQPRPGGEVWVKYELLRGYTVSTIFSIRWNERNDLVAVSSQNTTHVFAVHPNGGKVDVRHYVRRHKNREEPQTLSVKTAAAFRVRVPQQAPLSGQAGRSVDEGFPRKSHQSHVDAPRITFGFAAGCSTDWPGDPSTAVTLAPMLYFDNDTSQLTVSRSKLWPSGGTGGRVPNGTGAAGQVHPNTNASKFASNMNRAGDSVGWRSPVEGKNEANRCWHLRGTVPEDCKEALVLAKLAWPRVSRTIATDWFAVAEIDTVSTSTRVLPVTLYRSKNVDTFDLRTKAIAEDGTWTGRKLDFAHTRDGSMNHPSDATGNGLKAALRSELDAGQVSPIPPALPNGETGAFWKASRHPILIAAKDIRKMRRKDSHQSDELPSSFGDRLAVDEETGFMYEQGTEDEAQSKTSPRGSSLNEDWEDDLIIGKMDGIRRN